MTEPYHSEKPVKPIKHWTGKHVLFAIVAFFSVIFIANFFMVSVGIKSFPGEDTKQSYQQGIEYNKTLAARATQASLGWTAEITVQNKYLTLHIADKQGAPVKGLRIQGRLQHLAETDRDVALKFAQAANDTYISSIDPTLFGKQWVLTTIAKGESGQIFKTRNEIWLK